MKKIATVTMIVGFILASALTGCSSKPSSDEMKQLEELRAEVASLEKEISSKESEKAALQKAMAESDAQLAQCAKDREALQNRLKGK
jgi:septal ring factor EnvC (AmiA/AmiB activator)